MYLRFGQSRKLVTVTRASFRSYNSEFGLRGLHLSSFPKDPMLGVKLLINPSVRPNNIMSVFGPRILTYVQRSCFGNTFTTLLPAANFQHRSKPITDKLVNSGWSCEQRRQYRSGRSNRTTRQENDNPQPQNRSPQLMEFPWVIWPSFWHTIRNWIFANLIIRPYLDKEFTLSSFKSGAVQAVVHVSQELSKGNFVDLEDFITKPSLEEAQTNFALLSLKQRLDLAVVAEDIFFCFPYQIGVMFTNEGGPKERIFVEITMCYHIFKGFQDHIESISKSETSGSFKGVYDNYDRISIANYRFIREFTKGVEDQWTVNVANHFKPGEYLQRQ